MAKEKIGIRFSARAETDLNIQTENESRAVFFMGEVIIMDTGKGEWKIKSNYIFPLSVAAQNRLGRRYTLCREAL